MEKEQSKRLTKNQKINILLDLFFVFLIPVTALLCLVLFYLDIMRLLMEHGIILRHNLAHAGATLTLIVFFSWRPYKWLEYKMKDVYDSIKRDDEKDE